MASGTDGLSGWRSDGPSRSMPGPRDALADPKHNALKGNWDVYGLHENGRASLPGIQHSDVV